MDKKIFSAFYGILGEGHSKYPFLAYFAPKGQKCLFSPNFNSKYLSEFFPYRNDQCMESPLKLTNFLKMLPKRAFHTHNAPKTKNDKTQISKIWVLRLFSFLVLGALWVWKALFDNLFRNLVNFRGLPYLDRFCTGKTRWDIFELKFGEKRHFWPSGAK